MSEEGGVAVAVEMNAVPAIPLADVAVAAEAAPAVAAVEVSAEAGGAGEAAAAEPAAAEAGAGEAAPAESVAAEMASTDGAAAADPADVALTVDGGAEEKKKTKKLKKKKSMRKPSRNKQDLGAALETFNSLSEDLRAALNRLFWVSLAASITHFVVTLLLFIMGYSPEGSLRIDRYPQSVKQHASSTVVVCAFGALTTCVYSFTSTYTTYINATKKAITTRFYHNGAFLAAVVRSFFLVFFLWPGLVIYMLHSLGANFWDTVRQVDSTTKTALALDIIICILVGFVDIFAFVFASRRIAAFKSVDPEEEEQKREEEAKKQATSAAGGAEAKTTVDAPDQEEEERKPIGVTEYIVPGVSMVFYVLMFAVLIFIANHASWNSGTVMSVLVHLALMVALVYLGLRVLRNNKDRTYVRSHMLGYRVYIVLHLTAVVAVFWVTWSILLLKQGSVTADSDKDVPGSSDVLVAINKTFFETVFGLLAERTIACILILLSFISTIITYAIVLFLHQQCLGILEEMAALNIRERTGQ